MGESRATAREKDVDGGTTTRDGKEGFNGQEVRR
jgi:hypothetical protein